MDWKTPIVALGLLAGGQAAAAQLSGHNAASDFGLKSGTQAPPGAYIAYFMYDYSATTLALADRQIELELGGVDASVHAALLSWVSDWKLFGGSYGAMALVPVQNNTIEAPRVGLQSRSNFGLGDIYVQPINLGWHPTGLDVITWYAFYAPTGEYDPDGDDNRGLGMWSHELGLGSTWYVYSDKTLHASALATFEMHSGKRDTDLKVGNLLTVEGGLGGTIRQLVDVGLAYYAQWKVSDDSGLDLPDIVEDQLGRNRNFGLGPELTATVPLRQDFEQLLVMSIRYVFEVGSHLDTQGNILVFTATLKAR